MDIVWRFYGKINMEVSRDLIHDVLSMKTPDNLQTYSVIKFP